MAWKCGGGWSSQYMRIKIPKNSLIVGMRHFRGSPSPGPVPQNEREAVRGIEGHHLAETSEEEALLSAAVTELGELKAEAPRVSVSLTGLPG